MTRWPGPGVLLWAVIGPHELAHWLVLRPWGRVRIVRATDADARGALARLSGDVSTVPVTVLRVAAVAPPLVFVGLAAVLEGLVDPQGAGALLAVVLLALWAAPSPGDLNVFIRARAIRQGGSLDARGPTARAAGPASTLLALLATVSIAVLLLA